MNAHPHCSAGQGREIALVHNGIIENYEALRAELVAQGYVFESQTDTEAVAHLIHFLYEGDILAAVPAACQRLQGADALAGVWGPEAGGVGVGGAGAAMVRAG